MSGRKSKSKGYRGEILLRDELRAQGYTADRQPMSGAIKNFEGDIKFSKEGFTWLAELKCRRDSFDTIYELAERFCVSAPFGVEIPVGAVPGVEAFSLHTTMESALTGRVFYLQGSYLATLTDWKPKHNRTIMKIAKMQSLLGKSQILVIRGDRKPFLYIRYGKDTL